MVLKTSHHLYPPLAEGLPTAPLVSISLAKLEADDAAESKAFYEASKSLGFFYMNMEGSALGEKLVAQVEELHALQKRFHALSNEEKDKVSRQRIDPFFGYRLLGEHEMQDGSIERSENYNMRKDDFVGNLYPLPCPDMIKANWQLLGAYTRNCRSVIELMLDHLEKGLQLPMGTLQKLHRTYEQSGDYIRFNKKPPGAQAWNEARVKASEHTDFGSLTILFNWMGGLQIRHPDTDEWVYVKPVPGSAIVNLGDALVSFTAGLLRSNIHRIAPAPAPQDKIDRHSVVYFSRPEDGVELRRLKGGLIDAQPQSDREDIGMTSREWVLRRSVGDLKGIYTHKGGLDLRKPLNPNQV